MTRTPSRRSTPKIFCALKVLLAPLLVSVCAPQLVAQEGGYSPSPLPQVMPCGEKFWKASMPTGVFIVKHGALASISLHEYMVQGVGKVTEMTVAMNASAIARFYHVVPLSPQAPDGIGQSAVNFAKEKVEGIADRVDSEGVRHQVQKTYPTTTHAHTIEYRVEDKKDLFKLFDSLQHSWFNGVCETCVIP